LLTLKREYNAFIIRYYSNRELSAKLVIFATSQLRVFAHFLAAKNLQRYVLDIHGAVQFNEDCLNARNIVCRSNAAYYSSCNFSVIKMYRTWTLCRFT